MCGRQKWICESASDCVGGSKKWQVNFTFILFSCRRTRLVGKKSHFTAGIFLGHKIKGSFKASLLCGNSRKKHTQRNGKANGWCNMPKNQHLARKIIYHCLWVDFCAVEHAAAAYALLRSHSPFDKLIWITKANMQHPRGLAAWMCVSRTHEENIKPADDGEKIAELPKLFEAVLYCSSLQSWQQLGNFENN